MPRANPNASFEVATKHLFRHLHEPDDLRANPLTRGFFEEPDALERIHGLIRAAAECCRDADRAAGEGERARRQYAIAVDDCLGGMSVRAVARALGISRTQYYRDRAEICARMARYVRDAGDPGREAMLAAEAADGLGRRREAISLMEPAMPEIERSGIALTIGRTYRIAGQITNDRRYRRKAEEVERATGT